MMPLDALSVLEKSLADDSCDADHKAAGQVQVKKTRDDEDIVHRKSGKDSRQPDFEARGENRCDHVEAELRQVLSPQFPVRQDECPWTGTGEHDREPVYSCLS